MPKVSVIIPVYNTAPYLEEAVKSIFFQTLTDIEIIAVNDGSTDNSLEVLKKLKSLDNRLVIYNQENLGVSIARNKGIQLATGEYLYFFDSDDILSKDCLLNCYNKAISQKCDFICFDADMFYDGIPENKRNKNNYQKKNILEPEHIYTGTIAWELLRRKNKVSVPVWMYLIRTSYIKTNNLTFYPNIIHEDRLFTLLTYLKAKRVQYIPENYFHKRMHKNSITTTCFSMKNVNSLLTICNELSHHKTKLQFDEKKIKIIHTEIKDIVNTIASSSIKLPFQNRISILKILLKKHVVFLSINSIILLLFPILKLRK